MQEKGFYSYLVESIFFFISMIFAGTLYVIPQIFLLQYYPESKNSLLTVLVIAGTIASIIGVWVSNNQSIYIALCKSRYLITILAVVLTIFLDLLFFINDIVVFLLVLVVVKFISNFVYNYLDISLTRTSTENRLNQHIKAVLLYQLLAYIIAPIYFSMLFFKTPINIIGISAISIFSFVFILKTKRTTDFVDIKDIKANHGKMLDKTDWSFLLYAMLVQIVMMIISSLFIFILRDYYLYEDAIEKGGILVGYTSLVSVVTIFAIASFRKKKSEKADAKRILFSTKINYMVTILFFMSAFMLLVKLSNSFIYLMMIGTLTGIAFGLYLHSTRTYANMKASVECKSKILVHYNNIPNIGALISLSLVYIFTLTSSRMGLDFNKMILIVVLGVCVLCSIAILNYSVQYNKTID